jgi:hypothetical protein
MGMFPAYPGWCPKCQGPTFVRFDLQLLSWAWFDKRRRRILPDVTFTMDVRAGIAAGMFTVERED